MKRTLKSSKGFSLVELIVVVLIMAIIAVALAPQVMKWVGNSRIATDASTYDTLFENVQIALTDADVYDELQKQYIYCSFFIRKNPDNSGNYVFFGGDYSNTATLPDALKAKMEELCGKDWQKKLRKKSGVGGDYQIKLNFNGSYPKKTVTIDKVSAPNVDNVK